MTRTLACLTFVFLAAGCAAIQLPPDRLERNQASIRGAEELGADAVPAARLHLVMAKDQTESALRLAANGDDRAQLMLSRAEADGELALGLARESAVHNDALKASKDLTKIEDHPAP